MKSKILLNILGGIRMKKIILVLLLCSCVYASESFGGIGIAMYKSSRGVSVAGIAKGSPASEAGLQLGDCIVAVNGSGIAMKTVSEVKYLIRDVAGKPLTLTIVREGKTFDVDLTRVKMEVVGLERQSDAKNAASHNYTLLDVVSVKNKKTGFYVEQVSNAAEKHSSNAIPFGGAKLNRFTRKSVEVNVVEIGRFTIKILTVDGSLVSQRDVYAENVGFKSIPWDNTTLAAGDYTIVFKRGNRLSSYKQKLK